jgi:catechol 2,3-dioxygenase-like lactoylglutathione lyase family enzyme
MKMIALFKCRNMKDAIAFYTGILDFKMKYKEASVDDWVVDLMNEDIELQLTVLESDNLFGSVVNVWVGDVDSLFKKYLDRGLDVSSKEGSPVHQGPYRSNLGHKGVLCNRPRWQYTAVL